MKPEEKVEIILWDWLKTKSCFVKEIYFNRKNKLNAPIFKTKGVNKKPDFLININKGYGDEIFAVEVKDNSNSINILNSTKVINLYYKNYVENKTQYLINNKKIEISGFLIATQNSPIGYLYKKESIKDNSNSDENDSKYKASKEYKIIPIKEGNRTFDFVRQLWAEFRKIRNDYSEKCSTGIIIADIENNYSPHIMISNFNKNKNRWSQKWWKI